MHESKRGIGGSILEGVADHVEDSLKQHRIGKSSLGRPSPKSHLVSSIYSRASPSSLCPLFAFLPGYVQYLVPFCTPQCLAKCQGDRWCEILFNEQINILSSILLDFTHFYSETDF